MNMNQFEGCQSQRRMVSRRGFTLLEMLIVVGMMAVIVGLSVGVLGGMFEGSKVDSAKTFVNSSLNAPLEQYRIHVGSYPSTEEGLVALFRAPSGKEARWRGPYIREVPLDPWGNEYKYQYPGQRNPLGARGFDLWSEGPTPGDESGRIGNW